MSNESDPPICDICGYIGFCPTRIVMVSTENLCPGMTFGFGEIYDVCAHCAKFAKSDDISVIDDWIVHVKATLFFCLRQKLDGASEIACRDCLAEILTAHTRSVEEN